MQAQTHIWGFCQYLTQGDQQNSAVFLGFWTDVTFMEFFSIFSLKKSRGNDKEGLKFMVQGDLGSGNVVLKPREGEKPEEKVPSKQQQ